MRWVSNNISLGHRSQTTPYIKNSRDRFLYEGYFLPVHILFGIEEKVWKLQHCLQEGNSQGLSQLNLLECMSSQTMHCRRASLWELHNSCTPLLYMGQWQLNIIFIFKIILCQYIHVHFQTKYCTIKIWFWESLRNNNNKKKKRLKNVSIQRFETHCSRASSFRRFRATIQAPSKFMRTRQYYFP